MSDDIADSAVKESDLYVNHPGTVLVSGKSEVGKVARYIVHLVEKKTEPIEIFFIGANAGQQAYKACAVASIIAEEELKIHMSFITKRAKTKTEQRDVTGKVLLQNNAPVYAVKDAFIWQVKTY